MDGALDSQEPLLDRENQSGPESANPTLPEDLLKQFGELRESIACYTALQADRAKLAARDVLISFFLVATSFVAVCAILIIATWLFLGGVALGLDRLLGGASWAGQAVTGAGALTCIALGIWFAIARRRAASRERTIQKYETRLALQRAEFGRDIRGDGA